MTHSHNLSFFFKSEIWSLCQYLGYHVMFFSILGVFCVYRLDRASPIQLLIGFFLCHMNNYTFSLGGGGETEPFKEMYSVIEIF